MRNIAGVIAFLIWMCGIVIAKGFWSTFFAVCIPFWAWYLFAERILTEYNLLGM